MFTLTKHYLRPPEDVNDPLHEVTPPDALHPLPPEDHNPHEDPAALEDPEDLDAPTEQDVPLAHPPDVHTALKDLHKRPAAAAEGILIALVYQNPVHLEDPVAHKAPDSIVLLQFLLYKRNPKA